MDTRSRGEAASSEQLLALGSCQNHPPNPRGRLLDRDRRTLAALLLVAYNTARVCPSQAEGLVSSPGRGVQPRSPRPRAKCWSSALWFRTLVLPGEDQPPGATGQRSVAALSVSALTLGVLVKIIQIMEAKSSPSALRAERSYYGNT